MGGTRLRMWRIRSCSVSFGNSCAHSTGFTSGFELSAVSRPKGHQSCSRLGSAFGCDGRYWSNLKVVAQVVPNSRPALTRAPR